MWVLDDIMPEKIQDVNLFGQEILSVFLVTFSMIFLWRRINKERCLEFNDNGLSIFSLVLIFDKFDVREMFV